MKALWYRLKAQASWTWALLLAIYAVMLFSLFGEAIYPREAPRIWQQSAFILDLYLPLVLALLLAPLPAFDKAEGLAELHLSYRRPAPLQLLGHMGLSLGLWALLAGMTGLLVDRFWADLPLAEFLAMLLPAGALGGAALAGSAIARHSLGGVVLAGLWWSLDLLYPAKLNRLCYLFLRYQPTDLDRAVMEQRLALVGLVGLALALWLSSRRERWVRERAA